MKWFLRAQNYSDDLVSDIRRRRYISGFFEGNAKAIGRPEPMDNLRFVPKPLRPLAHTAILRHMEPNHYGQVVTLDEVRQILSLMATAVRFPCVCRRITTHTEQRHCFGFSLKPDSLGAVGLVDASYWDGPDGNGLEKLEPAVALQLIEQMDRDGLVHSIWTMRTPFIASLCNCGPKDCRAMKALLEHELRVLHRGESVATVDVGRCSGCGLCVKRCHFGALSVPAGSFPRSASVDEAHCMGCGLCSEVCRVGALTTTPRVH